MHTKPLSEFLGLRITFSEICGNRNLKPIQSVLEFGLLPGRWITLSLTEGVVQAKALDGAAVKLDIIEAYE